MIRPHHATRETRSHQRAGSRWCVGWLLGRISSLFRQAGPAKGRERRGSSHHRSVAAVIRPDRRSRLAATQRGALPSNSPSNKGRVKQLTVAKERGSPRPPLLICLAELGAAATDTIVLAMAENSKVLMQFCLSNCEIFFHGKSFRLTVLRSYYYHFLEHVCHQLFLCLVPNLTIKSCDLLPQN